MAQHWPTAAVTTTRSTVKNKDPYRGPRRVDFRPPDEEFGLEEAQNLRSGGALPPKKKPHMWAAAVRR